MTKVVLKETPSGNIELVDTGIFTLLQFNTTCEDAMPVCQGMCCRMRSHYNTELTPEEAASGKYETTTFEKHPGSTFLAFKSANGSCVHQDDETRKCLVHDDKPIRCSNWHCSPGGQGEGIEFRAKGWFLSPAGGFVPAQGTQTTAPGKAS